MTDHTPLTSEQLAVIKDQLARRVAGWHVYETLPRLIAEVERLRAALTEATEEMEDMIAYVPDHFREKWEYDEAIARAKAAMNG